MISLLSEPQLEIDGHRSTLVLWACEAFDDEYSFRDLLTGITAVLEATRPVVLTLPPEQPREDFVEGGMRWGGTVYDVYFERSLGYLELSSVSESDLRELLGKLKNDLTWAER